MGIVKRKTNEVQMQNITLNAKDWWQPETKQRQDVPVLDKQGNVIGHVSKSCTSIGASKLAKASVQFRRVGRCHCWQIVQTCVS